MAKGWIVDRFFKTNLSVEIDVSEPDVASITIELVDQENNPVEESIQLMVKFAEDNGDIFSTSEISVSTGTLVSEGAYFCIVSTNSSGIAILSIGNGVLGADLYTFVEIVPLGVHIPPYAELVTIIPTP